MISIICPPYHPQFEWQTDLFWFNHKKVYGENAYKTAFAAVLKRNSCDEPKHEIFNWKMDIPHMMCESVFDYETDIDVNNGYYRPLNIQVGLKQIIDKFSDDQIIEILECDMFHMKPSPVMAVNDDELLTCDLYENWHLYSLSKLKHVVDPFIKETDPIFYNGGFEPIIGNVRTFKKILNTWIDVHKIIIMNNSENSSIKWWAGMYSLQIACQTHKVKMITVNKCYIPSFNQIEDDHYACHYSVDSIFTKKTFPHIHLDKFQDNLFYNLIREWLTTRGS